MEFSFKVDAFSKLTYNRCFKCGRDDNKDTFFFFFKERSLYRDDNVSIRGHLKVSDIFITN